MHPCNTRVSFSPASSNNLIPHLAAITDNLFALLLAFICPWSLIKCHRFKFLLRQHLTSRDPRMFARSIAAKWITLTFNCMQNLEIVYHSSVGFLGSRQWFSCFKWCWLWLHQECIPQRDHWGQSVQDDLTPVSDTSQGLRNGSCWLGLWLASVARLEFPNVNVNF